MTRQRYDNFLKWQDEMIEFLAQLLLICAAIDHHRLDPLAQIDTNRRQRIVFSLFLFTFASEGGRGTPPVPFEPSKDHRTGGFFVIEEGSPSPPRIDLEPLASIDRNHISSAEDSFVTFDTSSPNLLS